MKVAELPFCRNSNPIKWQDPLFALLAIAFYLPSYLHDHISVRCRSANVSKSDRNIHRLATLLSKGAILCKFLIHHIC